MILLFCEKKPLLVKQITSNLVEMCLNKVDIYFSKTYNEYIFIHFQTLKVCVQKIEDFKGGEIRSAKVKRIKKIAKP